MGRFLPGIVGIALLCLTPATVQAQTGGRVSTEDGTPLPGATVEVWGRAVVLHVTETDRRGLFTLPDRNDERVTRWVFRYLGHEVEIVQKEDFRDGMEVVLSAEPAFELEAITATVSRESCPQEDRPEARDLWRAAASSYNWHTSRRGVGGFYEADIGEVNERRLFTELGSDIDADLPMWTGWHAGQRAERGRVLTLEEVVPTAGYAWERRVEGPEYFLGRDRHLNWTYAELDTRSANHFATPTFGELHTFSVVREENAGVRLRFCPRARDADRPSIQGAILVGHDNELLEAQWRFVTGEPDEEAGGWVEFGTAKDPTGDRPHLVARRSLFHRHNGFESPFPDLPRWVFRDLRSWSGWVVSPTDGKPPSIRSAASRDEK